MDNSSKRKPRLTVFGSLLIKTPCLLQYCMPTDAPHLAKHGAFAMAMSPLLWQRFKPDRFDSYSAGNAQDCRPSSA